MDSHEEEEIHQDASPTEVASLQKELAASRDEIASCSHMDYIALKLTLSFTIIFEKHQPRSSNNEYIFTQQGPSLVVALGLRSRNEKPGSGKPGRSHEKEALGDAKFRRAAKTERKKRALAEKAAGVAMKTGQESYAMDIDNGLEHPIVIKDEDPDLPVNFGHGTCIPS